MFKEVASLVFDLGIFFVGLPDDSKNKLLALYDDFTSKENDPTRLCRL